MPEQDAPVRKAQRARRPHVAALLLPQRFRADQPAGAHPGRQADRQKHAQQALAHHHRDRQHEQQARNRRERRRQPDHEIVRLAAEIAAEAPEQDAQRNRDERRHHADLERDARALHQPQAHVASQPVRAQPVRRARRQVARGQVLRLPRRRHVAPCEPRIRELARQRRQAEDRQHRQARPRRAAGPDAPPRLAPERNAAGFPDVRFRAHASFTRGSTHASATSASTFAAVNSSAPTSTIARTTSTSAEWMAFRLR